MKTSQKPIILSLGIAIFGLLVSPAVLANPLAPSQIQQINSGLFRSNSQDFFEEGRRNFNREIEILLQEFLNSDREILKIDRELRSQLCRGKIKISSRELGIIKVSQINDLNAKFKEICLAN
ncbi:hypothetical protein BCD67_21545 [Oscillatoriales cyanobacterium USR001]|nr:hypothetical protein BCD67_21545 [Oscillatoriales cyanobacterium USR001]